MQQLNGLEAARSWSRERHLTIPAEDAALVRDIIRQVAERGDAAVRELSERFDGTAPERLQVDSAALEAAHSGLAAELLAAIRLAVHRVRNFYSHQEGNGFSYTEADSGFGLMV